jgi:endogenous inhibitor of DNA gyrase (YacG/DUF329 family)
MACPICGKPPEPKYRPFCSARCADLDLARWFRGDYVIPGSVSEEEETPDREGEERDG